MGRSASTGPGPAAWDDETHPTKGQKGDTAFLRDNYKFCTVGSIFRTPKARFTHDQIHAGAAKAGWVVRIDEDGPWLKVVVTGKTVATGPGCGTRTRSSVASQAHCATGHSERSGK